MKCKIGSSVGELTCPKSTPGRYKLDIHYKKMDKSKGKQINVVMRQNKY